MCGLVIGMRVTLAPGYAEPEGGEPAYVEALRPQAPRELDRLASGRVTTRLSRADPIAGDGADLPPALRGMRAATVEMGLGETEDFSFVPTQSAA
jgi:hypothetical protein